MMTGDGRVSDVRRVPEQKEPQDAAARVGRAGRPARRHTGAAVLPGAFRGPGAVCARVAQAKYSPSSWSLIVVNRWNRIPDDYPAPKLTRLSNGESVDSRIYPDLQRMFDDMRAAGLHPEVTSAYRTEAVQRQLLERRYSCIRTRARRRRRREDRRRNGWPSRGPASTSWAWRWTSTRAGPPAPRTASTSTSGLQTTRGVRIILRYPRGKTDVTGNAYESWHYRYVGAEAAKAMHESGQTLEEYVK